MGRGWRSEWREASPSYLWPYFLGTAIGILPGTTSYVALGAFGLEPGWGTGLALAVLALLTLAGTAAPVLRKRKGTRV